MTESAQTAPQLERSIGLGRVLFQSIGVMGPGASIVFGLGLIIANTGKASPFAMLLALIAAVFVANAVGQMAARIPGAGRLYSFAAASLGPDAGFLVGWGLTSSSRAMVHVGSVGARIYRTFVCADHESLLGWSQHFEKLKRGVGRFGC